MVFCPKIIKYTGVGMVTHGMEHLIAGSTTWGSYAVQTMETCCKSLHQCDVQKRAELNNTLIEGDIRNCECENQFRKCFETPKLFDLIGFADDYSMKTEKCYSVDHPIIKCEQYKCYYHPKETYYQYPSRHLSYAIRCVKYKLNESKPKIYQTFQLPFYFEYDSYDSYELLELVAAQYNDGNL